MGKFTNGKMINTDLSTSSISNRSTIAATAISDPRNTGISRTNIIENITNSKLKRITDNPFYFFNNMPMTKVTFYNVDKNETTLDEVVDNTYNFIGPASGLRFDKINGVILYGIQRMELNIDMGEWGTEADPIEGDAVLPPNTFVPYVNSYFSIDYINQTSNEVLFRITSVNIDTFPNGSNFYKINYKLESIGEDINPQVVKEYQYLSSNVGKGNVLIDSDTYDLMNSYSDIISNLKQAYYELFFQDTTQTFVFKYGFYDYFFYDPYLIEFMIRNKIFSASDDMYIYLSQPAYPPMYFNIDYNHTIFKYVEDLKSTICYFYGYGLLVQDPMSLLTHRIEPYYMITVRDDDGSSLVGCRLLEQIPLFDIDLINLLGYGIDNNKICKYECDCNSIMKNLPNYKQYYEILYRYFNGLSISSSLIETINNINFVPCKELYYTIPLLIYIIQKMVSNMNNDSIDTSNYSDATNAQNSCPKGCLEC
jgi:hypothetical protein